MNTIHGISTSPVQLQAPDQNPVSKSSTSFGEMFQNLVSEVNNSQLTGDNAVAQLQSGKARHLHEVMLAVEEADMSLRMLVQMRNKALTAYEEIMRLQI